MKRIILLTILPFLWGWGLVFGQHPILLTQGGNLTVSPGANLTIKGHYRNESSGGIHNEGWIWLTGDLINNGTDTLEMGNNGFLVLNGTDPQKIEGSQPIGLGTLRLDNGDGLSLDQDLLIFGQLNLFWGNVNLNGRVIDFGFTGAMVGETDTSRVMGIAGELRARAFLNAPTGRNVANLGIELTSSTNLGMTLIERGHGAQNVRGNTSIHRYFNLEPSQTSSIDASLTFNFFDPIELNGLPEQALAMWRSGDNGSTWQYLDGGVDTLANAFSVNNLDALGRVTLGCPLPQLNSPKYAGGVNITCFEGMNGSIDLLIGAGTQGFSFLWSGPNGFSSTAQNLTGLEAGTYQVQISHPSGCSSADSIVLTSPSEVVIDSLTAEQIDCNHAGQIEVFASGGLGTYKYHLSGTTNTSNSTGLFTGLVQGTYSVQVEDPVHGCFSNVEIVPITWGGPTFLDSLTHVTMTGGNDGIIQFIGLVGGTPPYTFTIDGGGNYFTSGTFTGLTAGEYHLGIKDAQGCKSPLLIDTLFEPISLSFHLTPNPCSGDSLGAIGVEVTGGIPPYSYLWTNLPVGATFFGQDSLVNLPASTVTVDVRDAAYGRSVQTATLVDPLPITSTIVATDETTPGANDGTITFSGTSGGTPPYLFAIFSPGTGLTASPIPSFNGLAPGSYIAGYRDANSCSVNEQVGIASGTNKLGLHPDVPSLATEDIWLSAAPNPFSGQTLIRFRLPKGGRAQLEIWSSEGKPIAILFEGKLNPGEERALPFSGEGLVAGIYYVHLLTESGETRSVKVVLIR